MKSKIINYDLLQNAAGMKIIIQNLTLELEVYYCYFKLQ